MSVFTDHRPSMDPWTTAEVIKRPITTSIGLRREMSTSFETVSFSDTWYFSVFSVDLKVVCLFVAAEIEFQRFELLTLGERQAGGVQAFYIQRAE